MPNEFVGKFKILEQQQQSNFKCKLQWSELAEMERERDLGTETKMADFKMPM